MPHQRFSAVALTLAVFFQTVALSGSASAAATPLPRLKVSDNKRFLVAADGGKPFFYLADTGWELFHRLDRRQAITYLQKRADQKYTAIQAVALAELNGVGDPNAHGDLPLIDRDPARPAITKGANPGNPSEYDYWDHVDFIVDEANQRGLYIALLPTWGGWVHDEKNTIFTVANAETYGKFLGARYTGRGVIWVLGGDRDMNGKESVWRSMARGIEIGASGGENHDAVLMTFHPRGGGTSSQFFHDDAWLDFNMHQTGHSRAEKTRQWRKIEADYNKTPTKPVLDGEPLYEDHPVEFNAREFGFSFDAHVRQRAYWSLFSGSCGHTYGHHAVWQMYAPGRERINGPTMPWYDAIHRPGAAQMTFVRTLMESRPVLSRVPDQSLLVDALEGADHLAATRGDGYAFVYSPMGRKINLQLGKLPGTQLTAHWYNPRTGKSEFIETFANQGTKEFTCKSEGFGSDWILVLDDAARKFPPPGGLESQKR